MKVLMVCLGNICRSPLAEGILKHKCKQQNLDWYVDSAGTGKWHLGSAPDLRSVQVAKKYSVDISEQRARSVRSTDYEEFDLIFAMDASNYQDILHYCHTDEERAKVKMILNEVHPGMNGQVPDPYYGGPDGFKKVFEMLDEACDKIIEHYR